jgi:hypothetical protein
MVKKDRCMNKEELYSNEKKSREDLKTWDKTCKTWDGWKI